MSATSGIDNNLTSSTITGACRSDGSKGIVRFATIRSTRTPNSNSIERSRQYHHISKQHAPEDDAHKFEQNRRHKFEHNTDTPQDAIDDEGCIFYVGLATKDTFPHEWLRWCGDQRTANRILVRASDGGTPTRRECKDAGLRYKEVMRTYSRRDPHLIEYVFQEVCARVRKWPSIA